MGLSGPLPVGALEGGTDKHAQQGSGHQRDHGVEDGSGNLGIQGQQSGCGGQTLHQQGIVEIALGKVEDVVDYAAQRRTGQAAGVGGLLPVGGIPHDQTGTQAHGALGQEGEPALGDEQGIGQVIQSGAKAGGQAADGAQQQAGQAAHDVGQGKGGIASDGDGHGNAQVVAGEHQSGHHGQNGDFQRGIGTGSHGEHFLCFFFALIIAPN